MTSGSELYDMILMETEERMQKSSEFLENELKGIRTGRATPALVDNIRVDYYGSPTPLNQLATISVPEPRMIVIKPFDASALSEIEKAIQKSDLGVNPSNDGKLIRLNMPPLSEEQRKKLAGRVKEMGEETRVALRNTRRDSIKQAEAGQKASDLTEDDLHGLKDEIQTLIKKYEGRVDEIISGKTNEILEV